MKSASAAVLGALAFGAAGLVAAQEHVLTLPGPISAGAAFSIQSRGSGPAKLYVVGLGQVIRRDVQLGEPLVFAAGSLSHAGRYLMILTGNGWGETDSLEVTPARQAAELSFLARPSRLPVGLHDGITGAVYVFDAYRNLITTPASVSFELSGPSGVEQRRTVISHLGAAWTAMNSTPHQGNDKFVARSGLATSERIVNQVPGDPCGLKMTANPAGKEVRLQTDPVRDCSGNAVPDGTIVTFTEAYNGALSTVDVPVKRGIAAVEMPDHPGAVISVASGVVMGNQIRWER